MVHLDGKLQWLVHDFQQFPLFLKLSYNQSLQKMTTVQNRATEKASSPQARITEVPKNVIHSRLAATDSQVF
jgi:hypothetical protein